MWPLSLDPPFSLHIHPLESKLQYDGGEAGVSLGGVSLRAGVCAHYLDSSLCFIQPRISHDVLCI